MNQGIQGRDLFLKAWCKSASGSSPVKPVGWSCEEACRPGCEFSVTWSLRPSCFLLGAADSVSSSFRSPVVLAEGEPYRTTDGAWGSQVPCSFRHCQGRPGLLVADQTALAQPSTKQVPCTPWRGHSLVSCHCPFPPQALWET